LRPGLLQALSASPQPLQKPAAATFAKRNAGWREIRLRRPYLAAGFLEQDRHGTRHEIARL
jgi:hypothetical protein